MNLMASLTQGCIYIEKKKRRVVQGHSNLKMDKDGLQTLKSMNPISFVHAHLTFFFAI